MSQSPAESSTSSEPPGSAQPVADTQPARSEDSSVRERTGRRRARRGRARPAWRRWLREFAVIAAGALAALAAQAWWQQSQDRDRERDYLRRLLADTRENALRIDQLIVDDSTSQLTVRRVARLPVRRRSATTTGHASSPGSSTEASSRRRRSIRSPTLTRRYWRRATCGSYATRRCAASWLPMPREWTRSAKEWGATCSS